MVAFCLLSNHFHLALWPESNDAISDFMHWLLTTHATRYLRQYRVTGHVWQGRFRVFPLQEDDHLLSVLGVLMGGANGDIAYSPLQSPVRSITISAMPRTARSTPAGLAYHLVNRR